MEIPAPVSALPHIPDDLTIPQFLFDYRHPVRPHRNEGTPWLIDDATGRALQEQEIRERVFALANGLHLKYGVGDNDVVLLFSRNHIDYPIVIWAVHRLGGVISGANPDFSTNEILYQLRETKATVMVAHPDCFAAATAAAREYGLSPERVVLFNVDRSSKHQHLTVDDIIQHGRTNPAAFQERKLNPGEAKTKLAFLSFSSGTTGRPKAVAIPHYSPIANVIQVAVHNRVHEDYCAWEDRRYRPGDVAIGVLPLYHIYGLVINLHYVLFCGMSLVVIPKFNFVKMLDSIICYKISHLYLVPPQVVLLCKHPAVKNYSLHNFVRMVMCGAAPLSRELNQKLFELLPDAHVGQAYGMTETCTAVTMWSVERKRGASGSAGILLPGTVARVLKEDGSLGTFDEQGELVIKSPSNALGYANNLEATKDTFLDGWVRTGDEVRIDRNKEVWILDRLKEIMKVKGFQVAPAELEGCILEHKDVSNACVVGVPDDYSGELPMAFVVLTADAAKRIAGDSNQREVIKASIKKHVAENKVVYKHLAGGVVFVDAIPISPSGKLLRRVLRDRARDLKMQQGKLEAKL